MSLAVLFSLECLISINMYTSHSTRSTTASSSFPDYTSLGKATAIRSFVLLVPRRYVLFLALPAITYIDALMGIFVGGGSFFLVAWTYSLITKKEGMGGGDVNLLAMMGAMVGWKGVSLQFSWHPWQGP